MKRRIEILDWSWGDILALPILWMWSLERRWARFLLDHFGDAIEMEMAFRRMAKRARETGASIYCPSHDCDWSKCPPGCHDDAETAP